jgi:hypothetical protein
MGCSFGGLTAANFAAAPIRRSRIGYRNLRAKGALVSTQVQGIELFM